MKGAYDAPAEGGSLPHPLARKCSEDLSRTPIAARLEGVSDRDAVSLNSDMMDAVRGFKALGGGFPRAAASRGTAIARGVLMLLSSESPDSNGCPKFREPSPLGVLYPCRLVVSNSTLGDLEPDMLELVRQHAHCKLLRAAC